MDASSKPDFKHAEIFGPASENAAHQDETYHKGTLEDNNLHGRFGTTAPDDEDLRFSSK